MNLDKIPIGEHAPSDINVIIEIPIGGDPVKYEMDKESGALFLDRIYTASMRYPASYGFIPHTLSDDGDAIDILLVCPYPLYPLSVVRCRPVGLILMEDEAGGDEKIVVVPHEKTYPLLAHIKSYKDLPPQLIAEMQHFLEHYKDLEKNKWVKISGWKDVEDAEQAILEGMARYQEKNAK